MTRRAEAASSAVERRVRELAEGQERALRAAKEAWASGERARRDKAIKEREAAVREATIRGLEPEVRRLMDKHRCVAGPLLAADKTAAAAATRNRNCNARAQAS